MNLFCFYFFALTCGNFVSSNKEHYKGASPVHQNESELIQPKLPSSCYEATRQTHLTGIYEIAVPAYSNESFFVSCEEKYHNGGWTVIQRRLDGEINFYRNWSEYRNGFGDVRGDYWIGLEKLHAITTSDIKQELLIYMTSITNSVQFARYSSFAIGSEMENYKLKELGNFVGTTYDAMRYSYKQEFSTKDRDNDKHDEKHCAQAYKSGWWYKRCFDCDLNRPYDIENRTDWSNYDGKSKGATLKMVHMLIRPQLKYRDNKN